MTLTTEELKAIQLLLSESTNIAVLPYIAKLGAMIALLEAREEAA